MASPAVAEVVEGGLTSAGTNLAVTLPAGGSASDEYIVIIAKGSVACTINALTGWTELLDENVANGLAIIRYTGAGVPGNPTFVQSTSSRSVWCAYRITGADKATAPEVAGTTATGTSTTPDPPSRAVTGGPKDILAIACFAAAGEVADTDVLVTTFPTNYTLGQVEKSAGTAGTNLAGILGAAARQVAAASSEDPGTFLQNASRAWRAQTIVVHPLPPKSTSVGRISLAAGNEPDTRTAHSIKLRARVTGGSGTIRAALYEGATNRSGDLESLALSSVLADFTLNIPDASAANITSYSDLEIRFWGYSAGGDAATFEIDQIWLEIPESSGPATYYGITAMPITFGKAVAGTKQTFGQVARPITFGAVVAGSRKVFGQTAFPITFAKDVSGQRKTFGQVLLPIIFGKDVVATKKTFGQVILPITFGKDVAGRRQTFSQIALPLVFGKAVDGHKQSYGQVAFPMTFGKEVIGQRTTFGQLLSPFIFGKAVAGRKTTFGQTSLPITVAIDTIGYRVGLTFYGVVSLPVTFGKDVRGSRTAFGQVALPLSFDRTTIGQRTTFGQVSLPIIFTKEALGQRHVFGQLSMQTLFDAETAAIRKTFGQIVLPLAFGKSVAGRKHTFGQVALPIEFEAYVDGFGYVGPKTLYGEVSFPMTFGKETIGQRKTFGQVTAPYIIGQFTQGQRETFGAIDLDLDLLIDVESGPVGVHGQVEFPIIFGMDTNGIIRPLAIILNLADMVYLGAEPVVAVYTQDQQIWP